MFSEITRFEVLYRLKRPATYIYFFIFLTISFLFATLPDVSVSDPGDKLLKNAPVLVAQLSLILMMFGSLVCAAVMGVPVYRDYEHKFYEIMHSLPIRKTDYLWGRFFGSFIISAFVFLSIPVGMALGFSMPWIESDTVGPFQLSVYLNAYFFFILPIVFVLGALFFIVGSYFRSQVAIYAQGVVFIILYFMVSMLFGDSTRNPLYALFDPFGAVALEQVTKYWTTYEKNTMAIYPQGLLMFNRLLWVGIALIASVLFNWKFDVSKKNGFSLRRKRKAETVSHYDDQLTTSIFPLGKMTLRSSIYQWWLMSVFYFKSIIRSVSFAIIIVCGIGFIALGQYSAQVMFGVTSLPVTYMLLDSISTNFILFALIIITVYSGELIWKEIGNRFFMIMDSSPLSNLKIILSKFSAMILMELLLVGVIIITGVVIQLMHGFYDFQPGVYFKSLFLTFFPFLFLMTFITFLIHTLSGNKFLGHGIVILFFVIQMFYSKIGITHLMVRYASSPTKVYSGMNGFEKFVSPALTYDFYWLMLGIVFLGLSILLIKRGTERNFKVRFRIAGINWKNSRIKYVLYSAIILFVISGCAIYYNTNVLNTFRSKKANNKFKSQYERTYSRYKNSLLPRIVDVNIEVGIYPDKYGVTAKGRYILVNKNTKPLDSLHFRLIPEINSHKVFFSRNTKLVHESKEYGYYIYKLEKPVLPGDSIICNFDVACWEKGFKYNGRDSEIVPNGTFFRNDVLPYFGYDENLVITDKQQRKKEGLAAREFESPELTDSLACKNIYINKNADRIRYEAVVSTNTDQIALTCGTLIKEWKKDGRRYFHYKSEEPIWNFFPFLSARYKVVKDKIDDIGIEIYYHPGHTYNLDKMMKAAKKTIVYCNQNFYPYQHKVIRIVEIPRYSMYAQSFAGIIPFSEGVGFIVDVNKDDDVDLPFYITAHEIAHQWWGHQVCAADAKGKLMIVESLANYTALMVMEKEFGRDNIDKALKYEQTRYLLNRSIEKKKEVPLNLVDDQSYIGYQKGSVTLYALRDYIGEEKLNGELKSFIEYYSYRQAPYPTSNELLKFIDRAAPDSMKYLINDFFKTITVFSNRIDSAMCTQKGAKYELAVSSTIQKFRSDSIGKSTEVEPADWINVGIYASGTNGKDSLISISKVKADRKKLQFNLSLDKKPVKVKIDPSHLLIDRNLDDNSKEVMKKV